ncbi:MAG: LysR family transcriptional regulator [Polyangiales bacterium]
MDFHQLKTFVTVAREGSVTRASERLHLSQPAVSAHIKALEDALGLALFERTPKGMSLTADGRRLVVKAEQALAAHRDLLDEATRTRARLSGKLRFGAGSNSDHAAVGRLLTTLAERHPEVEVALKHGTSAEILAGLRNGSLDAGFYNEPGAPDDDLRVMEVSRFKVKMVAPPGLVSAREVDWAALAEATWIYPTASACCGRTAEAIFAAQRFRPRRVVSVDRVEMTRALVAGGMGVGLLHEDAAREAAARGEVEVVYEADGAVRVLFARLASREGDPLVAAAAAIMRGEPARGP